MWKMSSKTINAEQKGFLRRNLIYSSPKALNQQKGPFDLGGDQKTTANETEGSISTQRGRIGEEEKC